MVDPCSSNTCTYRRGNHPLTSFTLRTWLPSCRYFLRQTWKWILWRLQVHTIWLVDHGRCCHSWRRPANDVHHKWRSDHVIGFKRHGLLGFNFLRRFALQMGMFIHYALFENYTKRLPWPIVKIKQNYMVVLRSYFYRFSNYRPKLVDLYAYCLSGLFSNIVYTISHNNLNDPSGLCAVFFFFEKQLLFGGTVNLLLLLICAIRLLLTVSAASYHNSSKCCLNNKWNIEVGQF